MFPWFQTRADASPLAFSILGWMGKEKRKKRGQNEIKNEDDLTTALVSIREAMPQSPSSNAIGSLAFRMSEKTVAEGRHFGHK